MSTQSWTVEVDGVEHTVSIETDETSGRASIRLDGHLAVRPLAPGDDERDVPIGSAHYIVLRLSTRRFDLILAPPDVRATTDAHHAATAPRRLPTVSVRAPAASSYVPPPPNAIVIPLQKIVGVLLVVVILGALISLARENLRYMNIPWRPYTPADSTFTVKFPDDPKRERRSVNVNGEMTTITTLTAEYEDHVYGVRYTDVRAVITPETEYAVIDEFLEDWSRENRGTILSKDPSAAPPVKIAFSAHIGKGDEVDVGSSARGRAALRKKRVFVVWVRFPESEKPTWDVREFLDSFETSPL